jgi:hypothetical protein
LSRTHVSPVSAHSTLTGLAFAALAVLCTAPFFLEPAPLEILPPYPETWQTVAACGGVLLAMLAAIGIRCRLDRATERHPIILNLLFIALAVGLTAVHWEIVDTMGGNEQWQRHLYEKLFANDYGPPHQYRPLPYGFVRALERVTHDWSFSCLVYRWFFTYWFIWGWYRLARTAHNSSRALLTLTVIIPLYPLSIINYNGQLADPLSHALLVISVLFIRDDRPVALAAALFLGVLAKETAVIVMPAYLACHWRQGWKALLTTAALGLVGIAAFLAARLPLGWPTGDRPINGAGLMFATNLGIGQPIADSSVPLWRLQNYLHPLLFVGIFLPFIAWNWRQSDRCLRVLCLTMTPLLLLSNLCYGWMYESRNYVPLLPLLTTLALPVRPKLVTGVRSALANGP